MKIIATKKVESVVLALQTGDEFEVTMIRFYGEDMMITRDVIEATRIIKDDLNIFGDQPLIQLSKVANPLENSG